MDANGTENSIQSQDTPHQTKRERKQVVIFNAAEPVKTSKDIVEIEGTGTPLGEIPFFLETSSKSKEDDDVVKSLHSFLFGIVGQKGTRKKNLRKFSGFPSDAVSKEKTTRLLENKKKWTLTLLKEACGLFGLQKSGTRDELCHKLVEYLASPSDVKTVSSSSKTTKRRASKGTKAKGKRSRASSSRDQPAKKKRAPSAYILFATDIRPQVKDENPGMSFGDLTKIVGEKWNELGAEEKKEWEAKAAEAKASLAADEIAEEEVDEDEKDGDGDEQEGENDDDDDEEVAGGDKEENKDDDDKDVDELAAEEEEDKDKDNEEKDD